MYLEGNITKNSSQDKINQGKEKLFQKYKQASENYLRENLFENACIIKSENCKSSDIDNSVKVNLFDQFDY